MKNDSRPSNACCFLGSNDLRALQRLGYLQFRYSQDLTQKLADQLPKFFAQLVNGKACDFMN